MQVIIRYRFGQGCLREDSSLKINSPRFAGADRVEKAVTARSFPKEYIARRCEEIRRDLLPYPCTHGPSEKPCLIPSFHATGVPIGKVQMLF